MVLNILRAMFVLLMAAVGWLFLRHLQTLAGAVERPQGLHVPEYTWLVVAGSLTLGVIVVCIDILAPRRKLIVFSGTFLGLIVGLVIAYALSYVVELVVDQYVSITDRDTKNAVIRFLNTAFGVISCYLSISFVLQTRDDFRFIIPYVEFNKQTKGARPILLDTSVLIDGRISDIATTGIIESQLIVPRFIQNELQHIADSPDKLLRARGRRGLDILTTLKSHNNPEVIDYDSSGHDDPQSGVDQKLIGLAKELNGRVLTNDFNLNKVARLRGIDVINLNELAGAMKPAVLPGETMVVRLVKPGEGAGQGVGYLDDGTMVVVEQGRSRVQEEVEFIVTNMRQTQMGRMIFGRLLDPENGDSRRSNRGMPRNAGSPKMQTDPPPSPAPG